MTICLPLYPPSAVDYIKDAHECIIGNGLARCFFFPFFFYRRLIPTYVSRRITRFSPNRSGLMVIVMIHLLKGYRGIQQA